MEHYYLKQCKLYRNNTHKTCFIPELFAHEGKLIAVQGIQWIVEEVYHESRTRSDKLNPGEHKFIKGNWNNHGPITC